MEAQRDAREGRGEPVPTAAVLARLRAAGSQRPVPKRPKVRTFRVSEVDPGMKMTRRGKNLVLEVPQDARRDRVEAWMAMMIEAEFGE